MYGDFMTNIVYSIYIINDDETISDKHKDTKWQLKNNLYRLTEVKKQYAEKCGAEFKLFYADEYWEEFEDKYRDYKFDTINLYKIHLFEKLSKEYDNVLYLDLDVIPNTDESFFDKFDMNKINVYAPEATIQNTWKRKEIIRYNTEKATFNEIISLKDKYDMYVKAVCKRAMLATNDIYDTNYFIANTAILGANKKAIKNLKFTDNLDYMIEVLNKAKNEEFYGETISKLFFPNNEVFFHYLLEKNNIDWYNLPREWHTYYLKNDVIGPEVNDAKMIHLINKKFNDLWMNLK